jgi:hypothetical protein
MSHGPPRQPERPYDSPLVSVRGTRNTRRRRQDSADVITDPDLIAENEKKRAQRAAAQQALLSATSIVTVASSVNAGLVLLILLAIILHYAAGLALWVVLLPLVPEIPAARWLRTALTSSRKARDTLRAIPAEADLLHAERKTAVSVRGLDKPCREIAGRARLAINEVMASRVYADNLVEKAAGERTLRRHEWMIAVILRDITRLRAEHARSQAGHPEGAAGSHMSAVMDPQRRVLAQAQDSAQSRVQAIEWYAEQMKAADRAQAEWESAMRLVALNDDFRELAARTAADEHVISELRQMTQRAEAASLVFQDTLAQAALAAEALALPPGPDDGGPDDGAPDDGAPDDGGPAIPPTTASTA